MHILHPVLCVLARIQIGLRVVAHGCSWLRSKYFEKVVDGFENHESTRINTKDVPRGQSKRADLISLFLLYSCMQLLTRSRPLARPWSGLRFQRIPFAASPSGSSHPVFQGCISVSLSCCAFYTRFSERDGSVAADVAEWRPLAACVAHWRLMSHQYF